MIRVLAWGAKEKMEAPTAAERLRKERAPEAMPATEQVPRGGKYRSMPPSPRRIQKKARLRQPRPLLPSTRRPRRREVGGENSAVARESSTVHRLHNGHAALTAASARARFLETQNRSGGGAELRYDERRLVHVARISRQSRFSGALRTVFPEKKWKNDGPTAGLPESDG